MYQGHPPPPPPPQQQQAYNEFIMHQELQQRLNYGPAGGGMKTNYNDLSDWNNFVRLELPFAMHHDMNSGSSTNVPDSSGGESEDLQSRFSRTPPANSQVMGARASAFSDQSWN